MNRWLTIKQAGEYLSYSRYKIYKLIKKGIIPVSKIDNGHTRIDRDDLDKLMLLNKIEPTKEVKRLQSWLKSSDTTPKSTYTR